MKNTNSWIEEENQRARELANTGQTANNNAPTLIRTKKKAPVRNCRSIYIQDSHSRALDKLAFEQKMQRGKTSPELVEEAIELLLKQCNAEI